MSSSLWHLLFSVICLICIKSAASADLNATIVSNSSAPLLNSSEVETNFSNKTDLDQRPADALKKEDDKHTLVKEIEKRPPEKNDETSKAKQESLKNESESKPEKGNSSSHKILDEKSRKKVEKISSFAKVKGKDKPGKNSKSHFLKSNKKKYKGSSKGKENDYEDEEYDGEYTSTSYDYPASNEYHENDEYYTGEGHGYDSSYTDNGNGQPQQMDQGYNYNYNIHPNNMKNPPIDSQLYEYKSFPIQTASAPTYPFQNYDEPNYASDNFQGNVGSSISNIGMDGVGPSVGNTVQSIAATALEPAFRSPPLGQGTLGSAGLTPDEYRQLEDGLQPINTNQLASQPEDLSALSYVKKRTQNTHKSKKKETEKVGRKHLMKKFRNSSSIKHPKTDKTYKRTIMIGNRVCGSKKHIDIHYQGEISKKGDVTEDITSSLRATDICCNEHNDCQRVVPAKSTKYGFQNDIEYDIMACSCDAKFRSCLKNANSYTADAVGHLYFNTLKIPCLTFEQETSPDVKNSIKEVSNIVSVVPDVETERETIGGAQLVVSPKGFTHTENDKETVKSLWSKLISKVPTTAKDVLEPFAAASPLRAISQQTIFKIDPGEQQAINMSMKKDDPENQMNLRFTKDNDQGLSTAQHFLKETEQPKLPQFQSDLEKHIYYVKKITEEPVIFQKDEDQSRYQTDHFRIQNDSEQLRSHKENEIQNLQKENELSHFQKQPDQIHFQKDIFQSKFQKENEQPRIQKELEQPRIQKENEQNRAGLEIEQQRVRLQKEIEQMQEQETNLEKIKKRKRPNIMNPNPSPNNPNPYTSKLRGVVTVPEAYYPRVSLYR